MRIRRAALSLTGVALATAAGLLFGLYGTAANVDAQDLETRTVALDGGFNLIGWTGPDTPFADAIADIVDVTDAVAAFDAGSQSFRTWNATAPAFLNTLATLKQGEAIWVQVTAPIDWVQPVVADPGPLALQAGFNLVTWAGATGLALPDAFAALGAALTAAFAFDAATKLFSSFGPSRPTFLNDLAPLSYGEGIWVLLDAPASWAQPAASAPAGVALEDGSAALAIPRGAMPAGTDASAIQLLDASDPEDPDSVSFELLPSGLVFGAPITLTFTTSADFASGLGLLSTEDAVEIIEVTSLADPAAETVTHSARIPHFSDFGFFRTDVMMANFFAQGGGEHPLKQPFTIGVLIFPGNPISTPIGSAGGDTSDKIEVDPVFGAAFFAEGRIDVLSGPLTPAFVMDVPPPRTENSDDAASPLGPSITGDAVFTCDAPGAFELRYSGEVEHTVTITIDVSGGSRAPQTRVVTNPFSAETSGTCVGKGIANLTGVGETVVTVGRYSTTTRYKATFTGTVGGEDGNPIAGATVTGTVTRSDGATSTATGTTGANGGITFTSTSASPGAFTLTIASITCPDGDVVPSGQTVSVTVE